MNNLPFLKDTPVAHSVKRALKNMVGKYIRVEVDYVIDINADDLLKIVSEGLSVSAYEIKRPGSDGANRMAARKIYCYVASKYCRLKHEYIASFLGVERTAVTTSVIRTHKSITKGEFLYTELLKTIINRLSHEA